MRTKSVILFLCLTFTLISTQSLSRVKRDGDAAVDPLTPFTDNNDANITDDGNNNNNSNQTDAAATVPVPDTNGTTAQQTNTNENPSEHPTETEELPAGMSESLADYVMDMLTGSFNNATGGNDTAAATAAGDDAAGAVVNGSSSVSANATAAADVAQDTALSPSVDDDWTSTGTLSTSLTSPAIGTAGTDCSVSVDLNNFCIVDTDVAALFGDDLTYKGLRRPMFKMDIVDRLQQECQRGVWCLDNQLDVFRDMLPAFYRGPFCEESMWECIFDVIVQREDCPDKEFMFVIDAADLLCEMVDKEPVEENEKRCLAYAIAALHVTYADLLANNMSDARPDMDASCEGYGYRMTKTYLCADDHCDDLFESRVAMEKFGRWSWFMDKVETRVLECPQRDMTAPCGPLQDAARGPAPQAAVTPAPPKTWFDMTTQDFSWGSSSASSSSLSDLTADQFQPAHDGSLDQQVDQADDGLMDPFHDGFESDRTVTTPSVHGMNDRLLNNEDESLMLALSAATAIGLLFMVIGLLLWRRARRRNLYYYKDGYGKLSSEAGPMLPRGSD